MKISLTPLKDALKSLGRAIEQPLNEFTRDSVIQRFKYTFELSWKVLLRYLQENHAVANDDIKSVFREAFQHKIISELEPWFAFHKARNLSPHTYNEKIAIDIYQQAIQFLSYCTELVGNLESKLAR